MCLVQTGGSYQDLCKHEGALVTSIKEMNSANYNAALQDQDFNNACLVIKQFYTRSLQNNLSAYMGYTFLNQVLLFSFKNCEEI